MEELEKQIKNLKNNISDINNKMLGYNDDLEKIKVKVTDFDVYDLFKGMEGDVDLDAAKLLIKNLENKMMKKFEIYDERNKQLDKDMFKLQEDVIPYFGEARTTMGIRRDLAKAIKASKYFSLKGSNSFFTTFCLGSRSYTPCIGLKPFISSLLFLKPSVNIVIMLML